MENNDFTFTVGTRQKYQRREIQKSKFPGVEPQITMPGDCIPEAVKIHPLYRPGGNSEVG